MALISPSGMATIMAMIAPMKIVPQKSGIAPNAPDEPAWSARIAVCGLQVESEQELDRRDHGEEAQRFEQQGEDDPERRQDRDQRGEQKRQHHQPLDPGAGAEIGPSRVQAKAPPAKASSRAATVPISR